MLKDTRGFSLIEMLIVISLIGLIGTWLATNVGNKLQKAKVDGTKIQMRQLGVYLEDFRRVCGFYPTTEQGLDALVSAPSGGRQCKNYDPDGFVKDRKIPKDGWDADFMYESDGGKYVIRSFGADARAGGSGVDKDLSSDELD